MLDAIGGRAPWCRIAAAATALVSWTALAIQLAIILASMAEAGEGVGPALWRFFGYFTILTNLFVAVVATVLALGAATPMTGARARLMAVVSIVLVGIIYAVLLRHVWNPQGWQLVADRLLHQAGPLLFLGVWALGTHGGLRLADALWSMAPPVGYLVYALARGEADGWYAYWFLDPAKLGPERMAQNTLALAGVFFLTALAFVGIDRLMARATRR